MSYTEDLFDLIPESVMKKNKESNNYRLWKIFSSEMDNLDEILSSLLNIRDFTKQNGVILDLIGELLWEKRNGKSDPQYQIYLMMAIQKLLCDGSIDNLNDVMRSVAGNYFIGLCEIYSGIESTITENSELYLSNQVWLDDSQYLDGSYFLSGDIYQGAGFEILLRNTTPENIITFTNVIMQHLKGAGIYYRIVLLEEHND